MSAPAPAPEPTEPEPSGAPAPANRPAPAAAPRQPIGVTGLIVTVVGLALVIVSFTAVAWLHIDASAGGGSSLHYSFADLHQVVSLPGAPGLPAAYFSWLAWTLLAGTAAFAVAGAFGHAYRRACGLVGFLIGMAGVLITLLTMVKFSGGDFSYVVQHEFSAGPWLAFGGFFVAAAGSLIGWTAVVEPVPAQDPDEAASDSQVVDG